MSLNNRIKNEIIGFYHDYNRYRRKRFLINRAKSKSEKIVLTEEQKRETIDFFKDYCHISLAFHNYYTEKTGQFHCDYIPEDIYYNVIDEYYNNIYEAYYIDNKCYYEKMFEGIPMPATFTKRMNGIWYYEEKIIAAENLNNNIVMEDSLFIKQATQSYGGSGVFFIDNSDGDIVNQFWKTIEKVEGDIIVQKPLKQHDALSRINHSSVNTIRVLSLLNVNGTVDILSVILRMGISGAKVDNATSGGITCGVNSNGQCKDLGYYSYVNSGKSLKVHPTSGVLFSDIIIPNYELLLDTVKKAHYLVPHFRLVSWDMAIDECGIPTLIEANLYNGEIDFHQLNNGPLFKDKTKEILDEVFKNS